jgi:hypothetical protein
MTTYHITYQYYDDAKFATLHSIEKLKTFMKKENLHPEDIYLVEGGNMISGIGNKHMPKECYKKSKGSK